MTTSKLLILTHCTYMEIFLKKAEIIFLDVNVIFKKYDEVFQFDLKDAPNELGINKDWKS